jgi:hypothetical protein
MAISSQSFVTLLHSRYRPVHSAMLARVKLGKLRQRAGQSVNHFVGVFQNTLTPIHDMGAMDQVHNFVNGLLGPIAAKVWEKHPKNLMEAIDAAISVEAMSNYGRSALPSSSGNRGASSSPNPDAMDINNLEAGIDPEAEIDPMQVVLNKMTAMEMKLNALSAGPSKGTPSGNGQRPPRDRIPGLTPAIIKECLAEGKCLRCKVKGHMRNECPHKPKNE